MIQPTVVRRIVQPQRNGEERRCTCSDPIQNEQIRLVLPTGGQNSSLKDLSNQIADSK
jgi:hypothetical protein